MKEFFNLFKTISLFVAAVAFGLWLIISAVVSRETRRVSEASAAAYSSGQMSQRSGISDSANPYLRNQSEAVEWLRGYIDAKNEKK